MHRASALAVAFALAVTACRKEVAPKTPMDQDLDVEVSPTREVSADVVADMVAHFARVRFATDSSTLDQVSQDALSHNAELLMKYAALQVEIQGHADERGTTDYNLALGERRAAAVRKFLVAKGVPTAQLRTVSYGEERPRVTGHSEVVWSENRRVEFVVLADAGVGVRSSTE